MNKRTGPDTCYYLSGLGTKPLPVDEIQIDCMVNEPYVNFNLYFFGFYFQKIFKILKLKQVTK